MPLQLAPIDKNLSVIRISGDPKTVKHLASLGIVSGASMRVLSTTGGVVVQILGSRVALGSDLARNILVHPCC